MIGRQSVWSKPGVQTLLRSFVPCADEVWRLQNRPGVDCKMFKKFADQGHYKGRGGTRQGIYAATPAGELLASCNSNNASVVSSMMRKALAKWATVPKSKRYLKTDPNTQTVNRRNGKCPKDGLILKVFSRDLPREKKLAGWRQDAWNQDFAWFRKDEARSFLPEKTVKSGVRHTVPKAMIMRLARFSLLDNVRGQTTAYEAGQVGTAELTCEVRKVSRGIVEIRLTGKTRAEVGGRGISLTLLGYAKFDWKRQTFKSFELMAIGERWGETRFNFRGGDTEKARVGFLLTRAGDKPQERVAPEHFHGYGW